MQIAANGLPTAAPNAKPPTKKTGETLAINASNELQEIEKTTEQKLPSAPKASNSSGAAPNKNEPAAYVPRSYAMVISSYENVIRRNELTENAADQLGKTVNDRVRMLNKSALRELQELPEYKRLEIDNIQDLGEEVAEMLTDEDGAMKALAFLKNPTVADLMEPREGSLRSFADLMQDNGKEKLMFGALEMINNLSGSAAKHNMASNPGVSVRV